MDVRYDNVTFCMSLARCRTAWLCQFLKPIAATMHDPLKNCASIEELGFKIDRMLATAEFPVFVADTAGTLFFEQIASRFPNARYLFVRRPLLDVRRAMRAAGMPSDGPLMDYADQCWHRAFHATEARNDYRYVADYEHLDKHLLNIWRFVGSDFVLSEEYRASSIARNVQVPWEEQKASVNQAKMKRLLSTIKI